MEKRAGAAAEIVDRAQREEMVTLPSLTREELAATGSLEASPLGDVSEFEYWNGLDAGARQAATVAALRSLAARGLVDLQRGEPDPGGGVSVNTAPELGVILAARRQPAYIAVGSEPRQKLFGFVRLYGILDHVRKLNLVLLERASPEGIHQFALCRPAIAAGEVSRWACGPATEATVRTVEVIRPSTSGPQRQRLAVVVSADGAEVADFDDEGELKARRPITEASLRERLRAMLVKAGSPGPG